VRGSPSGFLDPVETILGQGEQPDDGVAPRRAERIEGADHVEPALQALELARKLAPLRLQARAPRDRGDQLRAAAASAA
jgi:hypothetical protein